MSGPVPDRDLGTDGERDGVRRCYVASPLGFTDSGRHWYAEVLLPALRTVVDPVDPWALTTREEVEAATQRGDLRALWLEVGARNARAIADAELLVAILDGQEADSGTAAEVGYAAALGKRCLGLRTDVRQAGEPGMALNLQVEAFVVHSGGRVCTTLEDLLSEL